MNKRWAVFVALAFAVAAAILALSGPAMLMTFGPVRPGGPPVLDSLFNHAGLAALLALVIIVYVAVGVLVVFRQPANPVGWAFVFIGFGVGVLEFASVYSFYAISGGRQLADAQTIALIGDVVWVPSLLLGVTFIYLLFPDGRAPSKRWRIVGWAALVGAVFATVGSILEPHLYAYVTVPAQFGGVSPGLQRVCAIAGALLTTGALIAAVVAMVARLRKSSGDERLQLKWVVYASCLAAILFVPATLWATLPVWGQLIAVAGMMAIPLSVLLAVYRFHLYDIDVVIGKTVVYGALAGFITVVYVGIVVGIGALFGQGDKPNVALSIVATAIVAVAFQPVRERVQRFANRLVYGRRASPYEVLAGFSEQVAGTVANEDVLPQTARVLAEGTGAARADVWRRSGGQLVDEATWPAEAEPTAPIPLTSGTLPAIPDTSIVVPVNHRGDLLGALSLAKPAGESLTPAEEKLLDDLASQAGLVLRNVGLTAELEARLDEISAQAEELRASRQRIIRAQDAERRRLERNIHDGAQQHLVALAVKLRLAKTISAGDPAKARGLLEELQTESSEALDTLRDLARGIYPPLLEEKGIVEALRSQAKKSPLPVRVEASEPLQRFPIDLETAAYFCCLEALQNAAKSAEGSEVVISLADTGGDLAFAVKDDGVGFDPVAVTAGSGLQNMRDRVEALGGTLRIESRLGTGTTVSGSIPARELETAT